jgi:hypothetical protein
MKDASLEGELEYLRKEVKELREELKRTNSVKVSREKISVMSAVCVLFSRCVLIDSFCRKWLIPILTAG